jgi:PadR family transcriptional regulator, regulatory protein PadR
MSKGNPDVLQGTLDLLILKTLARGPQHGYGIACHIQEVSDEVLRVEEGSLYPALHRIEQAGWISSDWGTSENNRRAKYYRLTAVGRKQLAKEEENWNQLTRAVAKVLRNGSCRESAARCPNREGGLYSRCGGVRAATPRRHALFHLPRRTLKTSCVHHIR